jgi:hypothetical protein
MHEVKFRKIANVQMNEKDQTAANEAIVLKLLRTAGEHNFTSQLSGEHKQWIVTERYNRVDLEV